MSKSTPAREIETAPAFSLSEAAARISQLEQQLAASETRRHAVETSKIALEHANAKLRESVNGWRLAALVAGALAVSRFKRR